MKNIVTHKGGCHCKEIEFEVTSNKIDLVEKPLPIKDNLILKAAHLLKERTKATQGVKIVLNKKIPMEKGLGGGSSNAATTLVVLNKLWETNLNKDQLIKIGLELGSDIPFFIHGIKLLVVELYQFIFNLIYISNEK